MNNIIKTVDGGKTWTTIYSKDISGQSNGFRLMSLYFINSKTGFVCKYKEVIYTSDSGKTWKNYSPNSKYFYNNIYINKQGYVFALGLSGKNNLILKSLKKQND